MTKTTNASDTADAVIIGAGLGGLATAARLANAGLRVIVCERASEAGGRGRSVTRDGFTLNLGAHALYADGPAIAMLRSLDLAPRGRSPASGGLLIRDGKAHAIPTSPLSMLSSTALELRSKFDLLRFFARLGRMSSAGLEHVSCQDWLAEQFSRADLRAFGAALVRLATYCGEPESLSADAVLTQLQGASRGALYLDDGWAQLVDGLVERCVAAGVELRFGAKVGAVGRADTARWAVEVDGHALTCDHLIVAGSPQLADRLLADLLNGPRFGAGTRPLTTACLDLGLRGEWPGPSFAINLDEPIYPSVPSRTAALAPAGHTLVSLVWYRRDCDAETPAAELRARLERYARRWMPDYESALVVEQYLPDMTVAHDRPRPSTGGLPGRPSVCVADGLYLVGDWVGEHGQLLDASLASAAAVSDAVLTQRKGARKLAG